jgi:ornithine carbamoyltransferase
MTVVAVPSLHSRVMPRDFLSVDDLSATELHSVVSLAARMKTEPRLHADALAGRSVALIFEKSSTRTRVSFEVGVAQLGGHPVTLSSSDLQLGRGETIEDTGRVLSRYVDAIVLRTFEQERLEALAGAADVPVVNALSNFEHPCQALADLLTIEERLGSPQGRILTFVGDGNNVAHSLLLAGAKAAMTVRVATPVGFEPIPQVVERAEEIAAETGGSIEVGTDPAAAAASAHVLYTDVWASMGQEAEAEERALIFRPYQLNESLIAGADPDVLVMHCMPAHRGDEISDGAIDGERSVVVEQAENRLHTEKSLLVFLLGSA